MKKLFVAACCLWLAGCAAGGSPSGSAVADPMESDGQTYVGEGSLPPTSEQQITKSCTIKNGAVTCF